MFVWVIKMIQYERINLSEGNDIDKTDKSKKCEICDYCYFKKLGFKSDSKVCNYCYNMKILFRLKNIAIISVREISYKCCMFDMTDKMCIIF